MKNEYTVSVRDLAGEGTLSGSIDTRYVSRGRMNEGTKIHQMLQKHYQVGDLSEVTVNFVYENDDALLKVSGRIDGILAKDGFTVIEEIKSTYAKSESYEKPLFSHLAQARIYSHIYLTQNPQLKLMTRVSYYSITEKKLTSFDEEASAGDLTDFFNERCERYLARMKFMEKLRLCRDESIKNLEFPFPYRKYQKKILAAVYSAARDRKNVFLCAPTGSGKTLDAVFPAVKLLCELSTGVKIFCLSAKSTQKQVAIDCVNLLKANGLDIGVTVLTAKEKACMLEKPACNPDDCPYAKDYYDKLENVLYEMIAEEKCFTYEKLRSYAEEYTMCPFELSLDISLLTDVIICDYNYVFDPSASLQRYFSEEAQKQDHIFLVDEAHNLVDRSRDMYSSLLSKNDVLKVKKILKQEKKAAKYLNAVNSALLELSREEGETVLCEGLSPVIYENLSGFTFAVDKYLASHTLADEGYQTVYDFYFDAMKFLDIADLMEEAHYVFYDKAKNELHLFCANAASYLNAILAKGRSAVFYSATLTPLDYHRRLLGGDENDIALNVGGIFPVENFRIATDTSISTTYKKRAFFYAEIAKRIHTSVECAKGNTLVFFPSYKYMEDVYAQYMVNYPSQKVLLQSRGLNERERAEFLNNFVPGNNITAFAVNGGVFAESVDLKGDALVAAVVCGVSLPMVCVERELIRKHFDENFSDGFEYAYIIPGMNKVLQAMGRVIRTSEDVGLAVLLDERFRYPAYVKCFPAYYSHMRFVNGDKQLKEFLEM